MYNTIGQLCSANIEFFERLTYMVERIGEHLSYISEYNQAPFQDSEVVQNVRCTV